MFSPIFSKVPMIIGQWNLVYVFLMTTAFWRFGYCQKNWKIKFPPPLQLRIFFRFPRFFSKFQLLYVDETWYLYVLFMALGIWRFHYCWQIWKKNSPLSPWQYNCCTVAQFLTVQKLWVTQLIEQFGQWIQSQEQVWEMCQQALTNVFGSFWIILTRVKLCSRNF